LPGLHRWSSRSRRPGTSKLSSGAGRVSAAPTQWRSLSGRYACFFGQIALTAELARGGEGKGLSLSRPRERPVFGAAVETSAINE
jgi:hypothetical protein